MGVMDESFENLNSKDFKPVAGSSEGVNADVVLVDAHLPDYITMHGQYAKTGLCHKLISVRRARSGGARRASSSRPPPTTSPPPSGER